MKKVEKNKKSYKLSLIASLCFILTFIMTRITLNLILGIAWALIGIDYYYMYKKEKA